jgi:hypothetical protein
MRLYFVREKYLSIHVLYDADSAENAGRGFPTTIIALITFIYIVIQPCLPLQLTVIILKAEVLY